MINVEIKIQADDWNAVERSIDEALADLMNSKGGNQMRGVGMTISTSVRVRVPCSFCGYHDIDSPQPSSTR